MSSKIRRCVCVAILALAATSILVVAQAVKRPSAPKTTLPRDIPPPTGYGLEDAWGTLRFRGPLAMAVPPGVTNEAYIVERGGRIIRVTDLGGTPKSSVFLDLQATLKRQGTDAVGNEGECGLLGMAFHPKFNANGQFFIAYSLLTQEDGAAKLYNRLARFTISRNDRTTADPDSEQALITQLDPNPNHNGGEVRFGPDGYLFYSMGDSGVPNDGAGNAGLIDRDFFAAIFRIDVDSRAGNVKPNQHAQASKRFPSAVAGGTYLIPADNPFIKAKSHRGKLVEANAIRTEIFATGLRNPWRMSFDSESGKLYAADVGEGTTEEINIIQPGGDYGWSLYEGSGKRNKPVAPEVAATLVGPTFEYGRRGEVSGSSISGGFVYHGSRFPELNNAYLFADFTSRRVMGILDTGDGSWLPKLLSIDGNIVGGYEDPSNGDALFMDLPGGRVRRLVRVDPKTAVQIPATLSQVNAFANLSTRTPVDGFIPYEPKVSFWSDHAIKSRWFGLPNGQRMNFSAERNWGFPNGTVWMKHFDMEMTRGDASTQKPIETRFLVKTGSGAYALTYQWREDGSDADLVPMEGTDRSLNIFVDRKAQKQVWRYPSRTDCFSCHTEQAGYALGFNTRQLNCPGEFGGTGTNQIQAFSDAGLFQQPVKDLEKLPAHVSPWDKSQPLEDRVRSYLAVNCVSCHQPGGTGLGRFDARPSTPLRNASVVNGELLNNGGDPARRFVVPGDADMSMLLLRLKAQGMPRMPSVGSNVIDTEAIALIGAWVQELGEKKPAP